MKPGEPRDIIVTVPKDDVTYTRDAKLGYRFNDFTRAHWRLPNEPRRFIQTESRVGFVWDGAIRAVAEEAFLDDEGGTTVVVWKVSKVYFCRPIPMKGFRGFRYYDLSNYEVRT